jgi:predicted nucleic acid-binding protein
MKGADVERVYLDANVFIYALEGTEELKAAARTLLRGLKGRPGIGITSELTLAEVLAKPTREGPPVLARAYLDLLIWSKTVVLQPVSRDILIESASYRAVAHSEAPAPREDRRNFLPDAIHVVTAVQSGCTSFVGKDARIRLPSGMRRIFPDAPGVADLMGLLPR